MGLTDQLRDLLPRNVRALAARVAGDVPTQMAGAPSRWGGPRTTRPQTATVKGLTPARIAALLQQADQGYPAAMCELIAEVERRDLTLLGLLSTRRRAVTALPWKIQPVDESPAELRKAEMVRKKILAIANFDDGLLHLMGALGPGYGAIELDWYNRKGDAGINRVIYRPQKWFRPDPDDPDAWRLLDVAAPMEGLPLPAWRFVVHVSLAVSGFPVEAGLGRALVWIFLYKNLAIKDWGTYGEIFGSPLRVGRYPAGTGGAEIEKLQTALDMLGVDASAVISSDMQVEFIGDKSGKSGPDVYERMVNLCNAEMAKGVLGQTLTTEAGSKGSQALGNVHNEVRRDILVSDARQLAKTITAQIVRPLVLFNVGPDEPIPAFILETDPPGDEKAEAETDKARADAQKVRAEVFTAAAKLGIKVPLSQIKRELHIVDVVGNEPTLALPAAMSARALAARIALAAPGPLPPHLVGIQELADRYLQEGMGAWQDLVDGIREKLLAAGSLEEAGGLFEEIARDLKLDGVAQTLADATFTADLVGRLQARDGNDKAQDFPRLPPKEAIDYWEKKRVVGSAEFAKLGAEHRARAFTSSAFASLDALGECKKALDETIQNGGTLRDFQNSMDGVFDRAGMTPTNPLRLQLIYQNNTFTALNVGRYTQQADPDVASARPYLVYRTIGDSRVRPSHMLMADRCYPADHAIWDVWYPINGHLCRCWVDALNGEEVAALGLKISDALPTGPDGALLPDKGFRTNPAKEPHEFDWSRFPPNWVRAVGIKGRGR